MSSEIKYIIQRAKRALVDSLLLRGHRNNFEDSIIIETTNICSLHCSCCPNGHPVTRRKPGVMTVETFDKVLDNIDIPVKRCFLHMCGEPFLNRHLDYFCAQLLKRKILPTIFSNGYGIDLELLDRILRLRGVTVSFSMDLQSADNYEAIRIPGNYERAVKYLNQINCHFAEAKKFYGLNVILRSASKKDVRDISRKLFEEYTQLKNITFSSMWPWPGLTATGDIAGHLSAHSRYCNQAKNLPAILWDGTATFCALDYSGAMPVGNLTCQRLSKLVNNDKSRRIRRALAQDYTKASSLCEKCVLPRFNSFTANINRIKFLKDDSSVNRIYTYVDEYFGETERDQ